MKTTLQAGMRILISRYLSSRGCGDTVYVTGPPGIFCPQTAIIASLFKKSIPKVQKMAEQCK